MSFILEALKKSEQQRQGQNGSGQKVRKRTLSLTSNQPARRYLWLLTGLLPLVLLCGWWLFSAMDTTPEKPAEQSLATNASLNSLPKETESPVVISAPVASATQPTVAAAEPAPVPSLYISAPAVPVSTTSVQDYEPAVESRRFDVVAPTESIKTDRSVATVGSEQPQLRASDRLPLYLELSGELRDRMPPLAMSMHFYNREPNRRLVRINDRLLHEGDLVSGDLELVEITPTGVILDFLGKLFELSSSRR